METYIVKVYGWEISANAFNLTKEQSNIIEEKIDSGEYYSLNQMIFELEDLLDIDIYNGDICSLSKPFYYPEKTTILVLDKNGDEVGNFDLMDIQYVEDIVDNFDYDSVQSFQILPDKKFMKDILFILEENKGGIVQFSIESDTIPNIDDFSISVGTIEVPENEYDFIDNFFFKGEKLNVDEYLDNVEKSCDIFRFREYSYS